jgi:hypothetical protein
MSDSLFDEINPVIDADPISLWDCLHDAYLKVIKSDLLRQTLELRFDIPHIKTHMGLPEDFLFTLLFHGVKSVRATVWNRWPGEFKVPTGTPREEESKLIDEYQEKWREESIGWADFETMATDSPVDISHAMLNLVENVVLFAASGMCSSDIYDGACTIFVNASHVAVERSDGDACSIEQLLAMGTAYWETPED